MKTLDEHFLRLTIALARQARRQGGEPFGAVLVVDGAVAHQTWDRCVEFSDPTFHAELRVISEYCQAQQRITLKGYTLYASTEPCPMCAGAIHWARISRVVFSVSRVFRKPVFDERRTLAIQRDGSGAPSLLNGS